MRRLVYRRKSADLLVQGGKVLLDDICEFGDFHGLVVEESLATSQLSQAFQLADGGCNAPAYFGGFARELAALFARGLGGLLAGIGEQMLTVLGSLRMGEAFLGLSEDGAELGSAVLD